MKSLALALALLVPATFAAPALSAAEGGENAKPSKTTMNTTCPVCDKAVDQTVPSIAYVPRDKVKAEQDGVSPHTHVVAFCSIACRDTYEQKPMDYADKVETDWQKSKNRTVK